MRADELLKLAERVRAELLPRFPEVAKVRFAINSRFRGVLGRATYYANLVELSAASYVSQSLNDHLAENTIRHELAHLVANARYGCRGHGHTWKTTARSMGCTGDRCTAGAKAGDEIKVTCKCGWHTEVSERRARRWYRDGRYVVCKSCKGSARYPWERDVIVSSPMPTRSIFQRG